MMKSESTRRKRRPGRPRGPKTFHFALRITHEQKRDLEILQKVMEGQPTKNGLIQRAISDYVASKAADPVIGPRYSNELQKPRLKLVGS